MLEYGFVARKVRFAWVSPLSIFMQRKKISYRNTMQALMFSKSFLNVNVRTCVVLFVTLCLKYKFHFTLPQPIKPKEASDSDFTIENVMLWPGMRFSLRSQCKRCSAG